MLSRLRLLADELAPVLHQNRLRLLEQAMQASTGPPQPGPTPFAHAGNQVFSPSPGGPVGQFCPLRQPVATCLYGEA